MELISIGFLAGAIFAVIVCGTGVIIGRCDKGESDGDTDNRVCVHCGCGNRGSMERHYSPQEMIFVLDNVKRLTRGEERAIMDAIIKLVEGSKKDEMD